MGMGRNGKSLMGIPWEWELVTTLGMGMGRNGNRLHGNGREWECKKPFPAISTVQSHTQQRDTAEVNWKK